MEKQKFIEGRLMERATQLKSRSPEASAATSGNGGNSNFP
jgi:hypothetical protein